MKALLSHPPRYYLLTLVAVKDKVMFLKLRDRVSTSKSELSNKHQGTGSSRRKYQKRWEKELTWLANDADSEGAFCKL